jgi:hypothetical protein
MLDFTLFFLAFYISLLYNKNIKKERSFLMELGNMLFGNSYGNFELGRETIDLSGWKQLNKILDMDLYGYVKRKSSNIEITKSGGCIVTDNDGIVFEIMPYYWGACSCGVEKYNDKIYSKLRIEFFTKEELKLLDSWDYDCDEKCPAYKFQYEKDNEELIKICNCGAIKKNIERKSKKELFKERIVAFDNEYQQKKLNHKEDCLLIKHNFIYRPKTDEEFWINWYKYPFRDSYCNKKYSNTEINEIFIKCIEAISEIPPTYTNI